jgi:hypothetical protein
MWYLKGTSENLTEAQADTLTQKVSRAVKRQSPDGSYWVAYLTDKPVQPGQAPFKL